jgi:UDP-glucose 4-epimerase
MKRVLVTGGSGFIGSHVVDKLADAGITPRIYDLRPSPHHAPGSVDMAIGDLFDATALRNAMRDCDAVIHLAAAADVGIVAEEPAEAEHTNARGTLAVLEAARGAGIRMIYGSTIWVYGESGDGVITEDSPLGLPVHLYTATKLAGEMYCSSYAELYGVPCTILRFGIPYGPRARPAAVIPAFVSKALRGDPLTVAGTGQQTRRFVYVEDLAEGIVAALDRSAENRVYNLASDETVTIRELADVVAEAVGDVAIVHTRGRGGDFGGAAISNERAAEELGWRASTPLHEGVRRYLAWLEPDRLPARSPDGARAPAWWHRAWVAPLACAVGTMLPTALAFRSDDFGTGQGAFVAITCLMMILAVMCLVPLGSAGRPARGGVIAGWLLATYVALDFVPWTRRFLHLGMPQRGTVVLCAMGVLVALLVAGAATRLFADEDVAADTVG